MNAENDKLEVGFPAGAIWTRTPRAAVAAVAWAWAVIGCQAPTSESSRADGIGDGVATRAGGGGPAPVVDPTSVANQGASPPHPSSSPSVPSTLAGCAPVAVAADNRFTGIWIGPAGEIWVAGEHGLVGRRTPDSAGGTWSYCQPGPAVTLNGIWGSSSTQVWAVGDGGTILRWNGSTWTSITSTGSQAPGDLHDVFGVNRRSQFTVWVVGDAGFIRAFDGTAWSVLDADARYTVTSVWAAAGGPLRVAAFAALPEVDTIAGSEAVVLRLAGGAWTREGVFQELRGAGTFRRMSGSSESNIWAVGELFDAGSADSFGFAAHFDGSTWSAAAGLGVPQGPPEDLLAGRTFTDVGVAPPDAPAGAWLTTFDKPPLRFDGGSWTAPSTVSLLAIDVRAGVMWATSSVSSAIYSWDGSDWKISNGVAGP